jgi:Ni/Fe-hydrogenase subunit HybB-like protein
VPASIYLYPPARRNKWALLAAGVLGVLGVIVYRWNMTLAGFVVPMDWSPGVADNLTIATYVPSLLEWGVALGIVSYWLLVWSLAARFLNLYPEAEPIDDEVRQTALPRSDEAAAPAR